MLKNYVLGVIFGVGLLGAGICVGSGSLTANSEANAQAGSVKIAVVDSNQVMAGYTRAKEREAALNQKKDELEKEYRGLVQERDRMREAIRLVKSTLREEKAVDIFRLNYRIETIEKEELPLLQADSVRFGQELRSEIEKTINDLMRERGLDFAIERAFLSSTAGGSQSLTIAHSFKKGLDITNDVTLKLNAAYSKK